jgi:uncharacterized membrane protein
MWSSNNNHRADRKQHRPIATLALGRFVSTSSPEIAMKETPSAVVHFYRAIVMHGDVWRQRLDATTNWAVVTTVGVISFAFTRPGAPPFILLLLIFATSLFLLMESRRYQIYDLWRRRIRTLNQYMVAPQLAPQSADDEEEIEAELAELARDLGRAVPHLRFIDAMGYRMRRNYGYIYTFIVGSWVLKLFLHPVGADSSAVLLDRAAIGAIPGTVVIAFVFAFMILVTFLALRAPSEQMVRWRQLPSPLNRLAKRSIFLRPMTEEEEERGTRRRPRLVGRDSFDEEDFKSDQEGDEPDESRD